MNNKFGPCLEKNCSWCCNPVKVARFFPEDKIPTDKNGEKIWQKRKELLIPEDQIDTARLETYDCVNFNKETGRCRDYENRPEICKNTSCIDEKSNESIDKQYKKFINQKFITKRYD